MDARRTRSLRAVDRAKEQAEGDEVDERGCGSSTARQDRRTVEVGSLEVLVLAQAQSACSRADERHREVVVVGEDAVRFLRFTSTELAGSEGYGKFNTATNDLSGSCASRGTLCGRLPPRPPSAEFVHGSCSGTDAVADSVDMPWTTWDVRSSLALSRRSPASLLTLTSRDGRPRPLPQAQCDRCRGETDYDEKAVPLTAVPAVTP